MEVPIELAELDKWVVWKYVSEKNCKPRKIPCQLNGVAASHSNHQHWSKFEDAFKVSERKPYAGVGFVLSAEDDICGVDLDNCINDQGQLSKEASNILKRLNSYAEISPSGKGIKIFCRGRLALTSGRKGELAPHQGIELYTSQRFFTVTGNRIGDCRQLNEATKALEEIAKQFFPPVRKANIAKSNTAKPFNAKTRAAAYAKTMAPSIAGERGHDKLFSFVCKMINGFCLTREELDPLLDEFNSRCDPPWSDKDLEHKISEAIKVGELEPTGYMFVDESMDQIVSIAEFSEWLEINDSDWMYDVEFPSHLLPTDGLLGDLVTWINSQNFKDQPVLALAAAISLLSIATGRTICDEHGTRTNLYMICLAGSGEGKAAPQKCVANLIEAVNQDYTSFLGEEITGDRAMENDISANKKMLYQWDEFGVLLGQINSGKMSWLKGVTQMLMKLWNKTDSFHKTKRMADQNSDVAVVHNPCVSFSGWSTPAQLWSAVDPLQLVDGFFARILLFDVADQRAPKQTKASSEIPQTLIQRLKVWFDYKGRTDLQGDLEQYLRVKPLVIPFSEPAKRLLNDFFDYPDQFIDDEIAHIAWKRAPEKAARLALISSVSHAPLPEHAEIDEEDMSWAISLSKWCTATYVKRAKHHVGGGTRFESANRKVLGLIREAWRSRKNLQHSVLRRQTRWLSSKEFDDVIESLVASGEIESIVVTTKGRPKKTYRPQIKR